MLLSILLTILKILGIAILAALGLLILVLLIVLLVPFRLNVKARYDEEVRARVHVSWLLRVVHVKFEWLKDHGLLRAKLLGIKTLVKKHIGDWGPQPAENEAASDKKNKPEKAEKVETTEETKPTEPGNEPASLDAPSSSSTKPDDSGKTEAKTEETSAGADPAAAAGKTGEETVKDSSEEEMPRLAALDEKLAHIAEKWDEIQGCWYDEKNRKTVRLIGKQLKKIGRHLKPTHFLVEGELGFGDPAKTGKIMGTLYSFYPVFRDHIRIDGNYEEQVMKLRLELKGRLRLGIFVEVALRLLLNKNLRHWIKKLTHKDKNEKAGEETAKETAEAADQEQKAA